MAKKNSNVVGSWAFTIGVIVALLLGFLSNWFSPAAEQWLVVALVIIGLAVGWLNVTGSETHQFLITAAILVFVSGAAVGTFGTLGQFGTWLSGAFQYLMVLFVPATVVVAIKAVFALARD